VHTEFWWGNLRVRDSLEDLGVDGRIMLKCFLKILYGRRGMDLFDAEQGKRLCLGCLSPNRPGNKIVTDFYSVIFCVHAMRT
jgi:hypothetical protein